MRIPQPFTSKAKYQHYLNCYNNIKPNDQLVLYTTDNDNNYLANTITHHTITMPVVGIWKDYQRENPELGLKHVVYVGSNYNYPYAFWATGKIDRELVAMHNLDYYFTGAIGSDLGFYNWQPCLIKQIIKGKEPSKEVKKVNPYLPSYDQLFNTATIRPITFPSLTFTYRNRNGI
jgi:hypothetical protein